MKRLAVITARGGSKRIPRKNIKDFCGKPILAYSIRAAVESGVFDEIMVSTDDMEIAEIAKKYGAEVPFYRSEATANDFAVTSQVLGEVIEEYSRRGKKFDEVCCIYPTAPFVTGARLKEAMESLADTGADSVLPVVRFSFPPQRGVKLNDGCLEYVYPQHRNTRSQDLEPWYHDVGQFYCIRVESFLKQRGLVMEKTVPLVLSEMEIQDIDTEEDWKLAELKYRLLQETANR